MDEEFKNEFAEVPEKQYRPDVRWWLAEGLHTDETLEHEMQLLDDAGFGAIEFLAMEEPGADSTVYGWGSEEWVHDSQTLVREAADRGMGVSMTSGTNWSNANLISITPDDKAAAKELDFTVEELGPGESRSGALPRCAITVENVNEQELVAVVAARVVGNRRGAAVLELGLPLTDQVVDGGLSWTAPDDGTYKLFFFWLHGTGQTASPSCATSYTINYLDRYGVEAFKEYWDDKVLTPELQADLDRDGRGQMYMDSLELTTFGAGGQFWGYTFCDEFLARRGYDITPYLPFAVKKPTMAGMEIVYRYHMEDPETEERFHNDLYQTMTDLYMDNMLKPMQEWLHTKGMELRAEISYGLPFEISQPGKYVDDVETESLEFASQIESYRGMAGTAHMYDRVYSSETGATTLNYMMPLDFYNQIIFTQFAAGVSKTVLHGYSSIRGSEGSTYWPGHEGMWPIFSERFGSRQPAYQHYPAWTATIARFQKLLREGRPRMDLCMLRLDYYYNNQITAEAPKYGSECELYAEHLMRGDEGIYWKDMGLQHAGYTWDYLAPEILEEDSARFADGELDPEGPGYRAVVVYQAALPVASAAKLLELARAGLPVVFVDGVTEMVRPNVETTYERAAARSPFLGEDDSELASIVDQIKALPNVLEVEGGSALLGALRELGVLPRVAYAEPSSNVLTCMKDADGRTNLFVYNMKYAEEEPVEVTLEVEGAGRPYEADCWAGEVRELSGALDADGRTEVTLSLMPGEATMLVLDRSEEPRELGCDREWGAEIELPEWDLSVESWDEGEKREIVEDRGLGVVTHEVWYETEKTMIDAGRVATVPWKDIPAVGPEVSGVGYYTTMVELPEDWSDEDGAVLCIGSTNGCTAAVRVNGKDTGAYNINKRSVEIGDLLEPGKNEIVVEVSSTLNNRLLARGYYDRSVALSMELMASASNGNDTEAVDAEAEEAASTADEAMAASAAAYADGEDVEPGGLPAFIIGTDVVDYGMTGRVVLKTYKKL